MSVSYFNRICNWKSSSSLKGNALYQYAHESFDILAEGNSVRFMQEIPFIHTHEHDAITLNFLSGGTSGKPEVVTHTSSTLRASANGIIQQIENKPFNSVCCLPLWHVGGWMQLERAWETGGKIFFCDFRDIKSTELKEEISEYWISLVPTQLQELVKSQQSIQVLKQMKGIFVGGAAMSSSLRDVARALELPIYPCYGSSETAGMVTLLKSRDFLNGLNGVGWPLSHAQIRLNPSNHNIEVKCASLCLSKGMKSYHPNSWLKTPDCGALDSHGSLHIHGRLDRVINTGGEKVNPFYVEHILYSTGLVEECMVIGVPDEKWGERLVAYLSPFKEVIYQIKDLTSPQLTGPMKPKEWRNYAELSVTEMGKPIRNSAQR